MKFCSNSDNTLLSRQCFLFSFFFSDVHACFNMITESHILHLLQQHGCVRECTCFFDLPALYLCFPLKGGMHYEEQITIMKGQYGYAAEDFYERWQKILLSGSIGVFSLQMMTKCSSEARRVGDGF